MKSCRMAFHALLLLIAGMISQGLLAQGSLEKISVFSPSLEGNLSGDSAERDVYVYLPPGYQASGKRYPVVYFLHGYAVGAQVYVERVLNAPDAIDASMAAGAEEVIIVMPDAFTRFGRNQVTRNLLSLLTGDQVRLGEQLF